MEIEKKSQWSSGAMEAVRVAAYYPSRLSKKLVDQTNIPASVDTILRKQVSGVTQGVLGYLLLGVVRIYSKKVQYVCDSSEYLRVELSAFMGRERTNTSNEAMRAPFSITLPATFQLEAFDLQISEERTSAHIRPSDELVLKDAERHFLNKNYLLGDRSSSAILSPFKEGSVKVESIENFRENNRFSLNEFLDSVIPGLVEEEPQRNDGEEMRVSNDETFVEVEEASAMPAHDDEEATDTIEQIIEMLSPYTTQNDGAMTTIDATPESQGPNSTGTHVADEMESVGVEEFSAAVSHNEDQYTDTSEIIVLSEMVSPENTDNNGAVATMDATPESKGPNASGTSTPAVMGTPVADNVTSVGVEEDLSASVSHNEDQDTDTSEQITLSEMVSRKSRKNNQASVTIDATPQSKGPNASAANDLASIGVEEFSAAVSHKDQDTDPSEDTTLSEMVSRKSRKKNQASVTVDVTPIPKRLDVRLDVSGTATSAFTVQTPAGKESCRISRKRKRALVDDVIILPSSLIKKNIEDTSDLLRKRRVVPPNHFQVWKIQKLSNLAQTLFEPLIPYSSKIGSFISIEKLKKIQVVEAKSAPEKMNPIVHLSPERILNIPESPIINTSPDQADIAPSTPVSIPMSSKYLATIEDENDDYFENDHGLINEDKDSPQEHGWEAEKWSLRTRAAASCFCKNFSYKRKLKEAEVASLFQILEGKNKSESAKMFYEVLVLKSGGYVDVKQQAPYDDIVITGTIKLKKFQDF